ncbi:MAG: DUF1801 domain-containing protein [Pseudomonadota bacterium]
MVEAMTQPSDADVSAFLAAVTPDQRRVDALRLDEIFRQTTGFKPMIWGTNMVGYGRYEYTYESGHSGQCLATGFAPRKRELVLYIMPGYSNLGEMLDQLGPHRLGKSCLYITRLARIDEAVLPKIISAGLEDLATRWTVLPR